jgi:hypothetical protein
MSALAALLLVLAPPVAREPVGGWDFDRLEDPLERRVASLLAGEPIVVGTVAIVPLHARVPSEAGHGSPARELWADDRLVARLLVEDGESYLRIVNPSPDTLLLAAGTVFARGEVEVAVARDVVIPGDFAALVPAGALRDAGPATDLARAGRLPPLATGSLLAGMPAFRGAMAQARALRGEDTLVPVLRSSPVQSRRSALRSASREGVEGFGGTVVGAVFLVGDRPVAAHVFARHDLFVAALPDLLLGVALAARDEEIRNGRPQAGKAPVDARGRALGWLRGLLRTRAPWSESYGAGFETLVLPPSRSAVVHAVIDQQGRLVHAGFHAALALPAAGNAGTVAPLPPDPPGNPDETPTGFRERRPRPTVADQRRGEINGNPGPHPDAPGSRGGGNGPGDPAAPPGQDPAGPGGGQGGGGGRAR